MASRRSSEDGHDDNDKNFARQLLRDPPALPLSLGRLTACPRTVVPEGIVKLNATGGEILQRCDGKTSVAELIDQLALSYNASDVDTIRNGVLNFLEVSHGKGWIRVKA